MAYPTIETLRAEIIKDIQLYRNNLLVAMGHDAEREKIDFLNNVINSVLTKVERRFYEIGEPRKAVENCIDESAPSKLTIQPVPGMHWHCHQCGDPIGLKPGETYYQKDGKRYCYNCNIG